MSRAAQPARLWLRPEGNGRKAVWLILDGKRQHSTGCAPDARKEAEGKLAEYIAGKHDPAVSGCRKPDETPIADVLGVYFSEVVPGMRDIAKATGRIVNLTDWWGRKMLSEVTPETCRAYVAHRATAPLVQRGRKRKDGSHTETVAEPKFKRSGGGGRRDLEDLRAAINHHTYVIGAM